MTMRKKLTHALSVMIMLMPFGAICSCSSQRQLAVSESSNDLYRDVSIRRDTLIRRDSVIIRYEKKADTVFVTRNETHYRERVQTVYDTVYCQRSDTVRLAPPEPTARSALRQKTFSSILTDIKSFLIIAGIASIVVLFFRIKRF